MPYSDRREGSSRVGRRIGTKAPMHKKCQNATKGVVRRAKKARINFVAPSLSPRVAVEAFAPVPLRRFVLANRTGRTMTVDAATVEEARELAVIQHLVRKAENARLVEEVLEGI